MDQAQKLLFGFQIILVPKIVANQTLCPEIIKAQVILAQEKVVGLGSCNNVQSVFLMQNTLLVKSEVFVQSAVLA